MLISAKPSLLSPTSIGGSMWRLLRRLHRIYLESGCVRRRGGLVAFPLPARNNLLYRLIKINSPKFLNESQSITKYRRYPTHQVPVPSSSGINQDHTPFSTFSPLHTFPLRDITRPMIPRAPPDHLQSPPTPFLQIIHLPILIPPYLPQGEYDDWAAHYICIAR